MNILKNILLAVVTTFVLTGVVMADSPKTIEAPDRHSVEVNGKIKLYRVQVEGMGLGEGKNFANAELFVALDSKPDMIFTLHVNGESPVNQVMADTLREAYVNKLPVTLYHQMGVKRDNNLRILMVQLKR